MGEVSNTPSVLCAACGLPIEDLSEALHPVSDQPDTWVHDEECRGRFWEAPSEFAEWDEALR